MKKYLLGLLAIIVCITLVGCGKKITLESIAKKFNESDSVKSYKEYGYTLKAEAKGNELVITSKMDEKRVIKFTLKDNIISNEKLADEDLFTTAILIDSIGQLEGYKAGELMQNLNAYPEKTEKYTVEKEGFELKTKDGTNVFKMDLSKKVPLLDLSDFYLKTTDFDMIKDIVEEKSSGNQTGRTAKLAFDVQVQDDYNYIYIGEDPKLTKSAYKSIQSALEVMYGKDVANKFKEVYPKFKNKKTTVGAFTITTNYKMEDQDESVFKDTKVVLVKINNKKVK